MHYSFHNDIALSKMSEFTNHPMRMCRILGFCNAMAVEELARDMSLFNPMKSLEIWFT
jgi:hypothetical protein